MLNEEEVQQCRAALDGAPWRDGKTTAGGQAARVKANMQLDDQFAVAARLRSIVMEKLGSHPVFIAATLPSKIFPPLFNCSSFGVQIADFADAHSYSSSIVRASS